MAGRLNYDRPPAQRVQAPEQYRDGPIALTDVIGRKADGNRYAYSGWIFGDEIRCAYAAMCSLFLPRTRIDLINTYADKDVWANYAMKSVHDKLIEFGYEARLRQDIASSLTAWRTQLSNGFTCDLLMMNSRGNAGDFHLLLDRSR